MFLKKCEEQLGRMEWLIMNLLKMGRLDAGAVKFNMENASLRDTIEFAASSLWSMAEEKHQEFILSGDLDASINHDREWLAEAISNIAKNAIEHTDDGGRIEIKVESGKLITRIYIIDNGQGISSEMLKKIFVRFYKGEGSTNPKSIGIGLSLAKSIVEDQNGELKVLSEVGIGTTFIMSFTNN